MPFHFSILFCWRPLRCFALYIGILQALPSIAQNPIPPVGQWREHLNYQNTIQVLKGDVLYCATATNLFSVNAQHQITRYSKTTGLNDIGVQCIGWDEATGQLLIAYTNSNLDVLKNKVVKNIGDITRSNIIGNKTIHAVYCRDGLGYLSTGLGVVVVNLSKYEIKDTWIIGNGGGQVAVNGFTSDGSFYYAATNEGLKRVATNDPDISHYARWQDIGSTTGLGKGIVSNIIYLNNRLVALKKDSLKIFNGSQWNHLYANAARVITSITPSENKILVCQHSPTGASEVVVVNTVGIVENTISQPGIIAMPHSAILNNGAVWVADQVGGLSTFVSGVERFIPNGPPATADGEMQADKNALYVAAGSVNNFWNYLYNRNGVYTFTQGQWSYKNYFNVSALDSVFDFITLAIDPGDASLWAGSYGGGLVHFNENAQPVIYKKNNSSLQAAIGDPHSYRISGLAFDHNRQLWVSNYGAAQSLHVRKTDGTWKSFTIPFPLIENAVSQILIDDYNQVWVGSPKNNGLICLNYGPKADDTSDDRWKLYRQGAGNGNLPANHVLCLLKDKNGFIWVGTDKGIGIVQCPGEVFSPQGCDALLPVIQQDRFAGLLFKDEIVQCMAVDGANRKWIGTRNGVWLVSHDGEKIVYRFTAENSPLLANDIKSIAVDPVTGEVFISTVNGICSFSSTATEGSTAHENVLVFPNPVPPGYDGIIAIRGLAENSLVKITELNGRLVHQTRSLGGQAIWDRHNYKGAKAASGVYLVLIRDDTGHEKLVTKIVMAGN